MKIDVKVATILLSKADPPLPRSSFEFTMPDDSDVASLLDALGLDRKLVGSVTVNKKRSPLSSKVAEGDHVAVIPAISGG